MPLFSMHTYTNDTHTHACLHTHTHTHTHRRISTVDSLVRVYASLHSLDPPPNLTTSVEMATASLEDHLMKEFIEKLQIHVSGLHLECDSSDVPG